MKKSRYTENQIISILKTVESGRLVKDVCGDTVFPMQPNILEFKGKEL